LDTRSLRPTPKLYEPRAPACAVRDGVSEERVGGRYQCPRRRQGRRKHPS